MQEMLKKTGLIAAVAIAVLVAAGLGRASGLQFKADILGQVLPSLLAGLLAITAITERAVAVVNDIWFGAQQTQAEDSLRLANRKLQAANADVQTVKELAKDAVRAGNNDFFTTRAAATLSLEAPAKTYAEEIKASEQELAAVKTDEARARLSLSFLIAIAVSAVGVRTLESLLNIDHLSHQQRDVFRCVDILLTAGVLTGGTSGINAITDLLGTYVSASRKRALERS